MPANVETMAYRYAGREDVPWHGLGVPIDRNEEISTIDFQQRAGANWPVVRRPVQYRTVGVGNAEGSLLTDMNHYVLMRGDNNMALSVVGPQYKPVQNVDVFTFFQEFCDAGDMTLETGGVLDHGRKVWALAQLKEGFTLANDDHITGHLLFSNSHDGDALRIKFTPIRVVCCNTLAMALADQDGFRLNHRTKFNPEIAKKTLEITKEQREQFRVHVMFLASRPMNMMQFRAYLDRLFPESKAKDGEMIRPRKYRYALDAFAHMPGQNMSPGTWWQGYNAITYMVDHRPTNDKDGALRSMWFGEGAKLKRRALVLALEMAR